MAIKSKGRTRGGRAVAAAPRRGLVVRKPPIWRRVWVWILVGVLALGGILFGLFSWMHSRDVKATRARETLAIQKVLNELRSALPDDRRPVPPDVVVIFPSVTDDLQKIGTDIKGNAIVTRGREIREQATASLRRIQAIRIDRLVPAEFKSDQATVTDAMFLMARAVGLYEQVGRIVEISEDVPPADQASLIQQATRLTQQSGGLFDAGYRKIVHLANEFGVPVTIPYSPPPPRPSPSLPSASPSR
jgi:hypothetical protein